MAEELQSLLDRIQREGIDKANAKADEIVTAAEAKAKALIADAEKKAAEAKAKAETDAAVLLSRSEQSIRQSARDIVLGVGQAVQETLERVLAAEVRTTLTGAFLQQYLLKVVEQLGAEGDAELHVAPAEAEQLSAFARAKLADAVNGGVKVVADRDVSAGISVRIDGGRVEHDFTDKAVMEAMQQVLRPALAKLLSESGK